ncbi:MAG TPA: hypothetical protein PLW34_03790 [Termitinemataceae bacterium]|nr:hypothetical protein [Termitinemataceae bacterium]
MKHTNWNTQGKGREKMYHKESINPRSGAWGHEKSPVLASSGGVPRRTPGLFQRTPLFLVILGGLFLGSCKFNPIFYEISKETAPKEALIKGSPSRIVELSNKLYVANGRLWEYDGTTWSLMASQPGAAGTVRAVAATNSALYALVVSGEGTSTSAVYKLNSGTWSEVTNTTGYRVETIFGANTTLFAGGHNSSGTYGVLYESSGSFATISGLATLASTCTLVGAVHVHSTYYLAIAGSGIYSTSDLSSSVSGPISGSTNSDYNLNGLILVGSQVVATATTDDYDGGYLLVGNSSSFSQVYSNSSYYFTGALALWYAPSDTTADLLLVGFVNTSSSYTRGYLELALSSGAMPGSISFKSPGEGSPTTVSDNDTYEQSLGRKAVTALHQGPNGASGVLFASTSLDGLWSCRDQTWNEEEAQ